MCISAHCERMSSVDTYITDTYVDSKFVHYTFLINSAVRNFWNMRKRCIDTLFHHCITSSRCMKIFQTRHLWEVLTCTQKKSANSENLGFTLNTLCLLYMLFWPASLHLSFRACVLNGRHPFCIHPKILTWGQHSNLQKAVYFTIWKVWK